MQEYILYPITLFIISICTLTYGCTYESNPLMSSEESADLYPNRSNIESNTTDQESLTRKTKDLSIHRDTELQDLNIRDMEGSDLYSEVDLTIDGTVEDQDLTELDLSIPHILDQGLINDVSPPPDRDAELGSPTPSEMWTPLDLSQVDAYAIPRSAKIFAREHPNYASIPNIVSMAISNTTLHIPIHIYLIDSEIWTNPEQLIPYLNLVEAYFHQARIQLDFTFPQGEAPAWTDEINQVHLYFAQAMRNPSGAIPDGFGNLPAGKAVINDRLMDRPHVHMNPLFLPGKPIGHEIGHVLGLPHVNVRRFLMAQGTSARNQLELSPQEAVIMRIMALYRFGGDILNE